MRLTVIYRCLHCRQWFYPLRWRDPTKQCCSRRCANTLKAQRWKGKLNPHLHAAKERHLARNRAYLQGVTREKFGALTEREAAIFNFAYVRGRQLAYKRVYNSYLRVTEVA